MKKIVIAGSASLQKELGKLICELENNYKILDYPKAIAEEFFMQEYPKVHSEFFQNILNADILLVANFDKKGIKGYIGAESFAELCFGIAWKLVQKKNIETYILQMPSTEIQGYDEIKLWLDLGWVKIWNKNNKA